MTRATSSTVKSYTSFKSSAADSSCRRFLSVHAKHTARWSFAIVFISGEPTRSRDSATEARVLLGPSSRVAEDSLAPRAALLRWSSARFVATRNSQVRISAASSGRLLLFEGADRRLLNQLLGYFLANDEPREDR